MRASAGGMVQTFMFICLCGILAAGPGCGPDHDGGGGDVGAAVFTLQWPDGSGTVAKTSSSAAAGGAVDSAAFVQAAVSDRCAELGIVTVEAEVRDASEQLLASDAFDCEAGEGVIENIPVGSQRRFILSGLDGSGRKRYHGEIGGVTITTGLNQVGAIDMELMNTAPAAEIVSPEDGAVFPNGSTVVFSGSGSDAEDGPLSGGALAWTSDTDGAIGTGGTVTTSALTIGTHTITLTATDTDGASSSDSITITIRKALLPDTGQVKSYTETYGEDADYMINPPSYTKLDAKGNPLSLTAGSWAMVKDNLTGLIWEVKTDDGSIQDQTKLYTWPEVKDFIANLNKAEFGGYSDWRLPTVLELSTLVYAGNSELSINTVYFPRTRGCVECPAYWSATEYDQTNAWIVDFGNSDVRYENESNESNTGWVRAVRGVAFETGRFIDNKDGTVTDSRTDLMWQQNTEGSMAWEEAIDYCEGLELAGHSDWRMPNRNELQSIVDYTRYSPAIDESVFPKTQPAYYWTSTTWPGYETYANVIDFITGRVDQTYKPATYTIPYVRAVRGGKHSQVPEASISHPLDQGVYRPDMAIVLSGTGQDVQGESLSGKSLVWTSDVDGVIGTGASISAKLSSGFHTISLTAVDSLGGEAYDAVYIYVSPVTEITEPVTGMEFELVPAGCYQMGCSGLTVDCESDELPVHQVCLNAFWLGKYEVTQEVWLQIRKTMPSVNYYCGGDCPVENVSWSDIQAFIGSMNDVVAYAYMVRLPTEAQWEYAATGAGGADLYAGGSNIDAVAWYSGNSNASIHPVGDKSPNALGLYDMSGNVWEWCYDWYGDYTSDAQVNPQGPSTGVYRVIRGGGFDDAASACRCASRSGQGPAIGDQRLGFRLAIDYNLNYRESY